MAKNENNRVLISFLGTGPFQSRENRVYKTVDYHLGETALGQFPFVSAAIKKHYGIDKMLLVGTVHSMWEEVYRWYSEDSGQPIDENIYFEIGDACEKADHRSPLSLPHRGAIENAIGPGSHLILIKYGMNDAEIEENSNIILSLQQYLDDRDELIVDVTHSFRSLPIYMMNLLVYLQNVSPKRITISHIHYGMMEMIRELGYAPILDLKKMMDVNEWITGAYNFMEFGNTYKLAKLLEEDPSGEYKDEAQLLRKFADLKNLNYLRDFRQGFKRINQLTVSENLPEIGRILIPDVIENFIDRMPSKLSQSSFQYRMARWHQQHHNYGFAFINLVEAVLSYCCELLPNEDRKDIRRALNYAQSDWGNDDIEELRKTLRAKMTANGINFALFNKEYDKVNTDRNMIAHDLDRDKTYSTLLKELEDGLKYFGQYLGKS